MPLPIEAYERERIAPAQTAVLQMDWTNLTFLHCPIDPEIIQKLLPLDVTVDTFPDETGKEMAWLGLVPFEMKHVRPRGFPEIGPLSNFPETNIRTYVHCQGRPGVWFFSLDAAQPFACLIGRLIWRLPYFNSSMTVEQSPDTIQYRSESGNTRSSIVVHPGESLGPAIPGTREFFFCERYLLYSERSGHVYRGQVHHKPYQLRRAKMIEVEQTLTRRLFPQVTPFSYPLFCEGVTVDAYAIGQCSTVVR